MVLLSELKPKHNRLKITVKLKIKIQKKLLTCVGYVLTLSFEHFNPQDSAQPVGDVDIDVRLKFSL